MTKEITKAFIMQQLQNRFKLRDLTPEIFRFSEEVIPTYDIGHEVDIPKAELGAVSVTSATSYEFFVVPEDEKWSLGTYNVIFMATGAYKVSGVFIIRANYPTNAVYLDLVKGQTVSYALHLPYPVILFPGDSLSVLVDDYTSTAILRLYIDYIMEKIR